MPWNAANSIFSFFFGINDNDAIVQNGVSDNATAVADQNADLATYRSMLEFVSSTLCGQPLSALSLEKVGFD